MSRILMTCPLIESLEKRAKRMLPLTVPPAQLEPLVDLAGALTDAETTARLTVGRDHAFSLPAEAAVLLKRLLVLLARGDGVSVVGVQEELTTQQAANLLNVSRQYLVRLLDAGEIPSRRTASHRRVAAADVLAYKAVRDEKRRQGLQKLTRLTEELNGYENELGAHCNPTKASPVLLSQKPGENT